MRKDYLLLFMGCLSSWIIRAQSFQNEVAVSFADRDLPAVVSSKTVEAAFKEITVADLETSLKTKQRAKLILGYTRQQRPVEVYYFPGSSNKRALIIGGMHGSELSSIEIARQVIRLLLDGIKPYYDVLIIPSLFPDNAAVAQLQLKAKPVSNFGRYTTKNSVDPNRQMPGLGKAFNPSQPLDFKERPIEKENQYLLQFIQDYKPSRIANLHAIRDVSKAGIYADPRTDCRGLAVGFETDSALAVSMAQYICVNGGSVQGNQLQTAPTALYYNDPSVTARGSAQKRNLHGSPLPNNRGYGVSLGGWATSAVCSGDSVVIRDPLRLITVEFPGYKPSWAYAHKIQKEQCSLDVRLYSAALVSVFLSGVFEE